MVSRSPDTWLWIGLAVLGYCGSRAIQTQLEAIRRDAEITKPRKKESEMVSQCTENAIKLETLAQLTQSANPDIKAAAVKIITERTLRGGAAWELLLRDVASPDPSRRDKALTSLRFLIPRRSSFDPLNTLQPLSILKALVTCLCILLPDARVAEKDQTYLTQPHIDALQIVVGLAVRDLGSVLEAGLISKWLSYFPFGGENASKKEKLQIIRDMVRSPKGAEQHGKHMADLLFILVHYSKTRREMVQYGLWDSSFGCVVEVPRDDGINFDDPRVLREPEFISAGSEQLRHRDSSPGFDTDRAPVNARTREESPEEQALRRRRREAMVIGENGRLILREDFSNGPYDRNLEDHEQVY